LIVGFDRNS